MTTQILATSTVADPINFENYALLFHDLTSAQADLDEETCPLPVWCILPDDRELRSHWSEVVSARRSLAEFLDAGDEEYSLPTSPPIMAVRSVNMTIGGRLPFDNDELLRRRFPPPTRHELEARVQRYRDVLLAYYDHLMAKLRDILYGTRLHERLLLSELGPFLLRGPLLLDEANFERFRLIIQDLDDGDDSDFDHFEAVQVGCKSLKAALEDMSQYSSVTDSRSGVLPLLGAYMADADSYREEMLRVIAGYLNFHVRPLHQLNPRWSHLGEPVFVPETPTP